MQLDMTINASAELLVVLKDLVQVLKLQEMQKDCKQIDASLDIREPILTPEKMVSVADEDRSTRTMKIDCTDLTLEEIRCKAAQINSAGFGQEIRALLKQHAADSISALPESNFAAFFEALAALDTANTQQVAGDDIRYD